MTKQARKYAFGTDVPAERSQLEAKTILSRAGASHFAMAESPDKSSIVFELKGRRVRLDVSRPKDPQEYRRLWRVLVMRVKLRLEEIREGNITVEEAFMPYIMLPDGSVVKDHAVPALKLAYDSGTMPQFLLGYGS